MTERQNFNHPATSRSSLRISWLGCVLQSLALAASILGTLVAQAAESPQPLYLRNSNPLLQTLGAPVMQGGELTPAGALEYRWILNMANHADGGLDDGEEAVFDGESYYLALELRYGVNPRLELGMDLPLVAHTGGTFDKLIKDWHDLLGLSNVDRQGPENDLRLFHQRNGVTGSTSTSQAWGSETFALRRHIASPKALDALWPCAPRPNFRREIPAACMATVRSIFPWCSMRPIGTPSPLLG